MKKLLFVPLLAIILFIFGSIWFYQKATPVSSNNEFKDFLIVKGSGASLVGNNLYKEGLIKSPLAFKIYIQITNKSGKIQAGEYRLTPSFSLFQLVEELGKGPSEIWVTIPEGLRREEIALRFKDSLGRDELFVKEFLSSSEDNEGYLFPDTYLFPKTVSAPNVVKKMVSTFESKTSDLDLTRNQIILASLIERETRTNAERPVVAGILNNRLDIGMALQVDATLQYAKGDWGQILVSDKGIDSPFNTYKYPGLPPAPIANPGLSSLKAAVNPEESDYFYYLHDSKGQIYYAKTLSEHNENIRKYLTR